MSGGGEVILFPKAPDDSVEPAVEIRDHDWAGCQHRHTTIDIEAHQLLCSDCDQPLDSFDWIVNFVRRWKRENTLYRQARQQATAAEIRVAELARIERNAKARIRKRGVHLSSRDARSLRDLIRALNSTLGQMKGELTPAQAAKFEGWSGIWKLDPDELRRVMRLLDDLVELRARDEIPLEADAREAPVAHGGAA